MQAVGNLASLCSYLIAVTTHHHLCFCMQLYVLCVQMRRRMSWQLSLVVFLMASLRGRYELYLHCEPCPTLLAPIKLSMLRRTLCYSQQIML